ncbi:hypothetical protein [uncultured Psychromonas sp.]|uniref:hypothetical protein n=1 Tax=uncultured Psychromonas sp. TaxID=173974 RepID=UPI00260F8C29|nr:hypothetical protein [uncultured Psychromonas sp.]
MSSAGATVREMSSAPLPDIVSSLGLAIAQGQFALDLNSAEIAKTLTTTEIEIDGKNYNLLELGFLPTFYAYTEATVEAKLSYTINESTETSISGSASVKVRTPFVVVAATVSASYARKFSVEASGSSSIAARLVALPPPEKFLKVLNAVIER